jgi:hypothetical protein
VAVLSALLAVALLLAAFTRLRQTWPDAAQPVALAAPLLLALGMTAGPVPPGTAAAAGRLSALRAEPYLLPDPDRQGVLFDLAAWPVARLLGDEAGVRVVSAVTAASALMLAYALARSSSLDVAGGLVAQLVLSAVAVVAHGAAAAPFAQALAQALVLLLLVHLVRRLGHLEGARDNAAAFAYLLLAQASGVAAMLETGLLVLVLAAAEAGTGGKRRALRLFTSWALSSAVVLAARSAPVLSDWPTRGAAAAPALVRGPLVPVLAGAAGGLLLALLPATSRAPRVLAAALLAGLGAAVLGPWLAAGGATRPGLALLAPVAAVGLGAAAARLTSRTSPGSRS